MSDDPKRTLHEVMPLGAMAIGYGALHAIIASGRVRYQKQRSSTQTVAWKFYTARKSKPVQQSEFFETMSEATRTGKVALAELQAKRVTVSTPTAN
jgi:hypothetical protein